MTVLTDEERLARGIKAATILENEDVMSFFHEQMEDLKTCLFNTEPEYHKEREKLFLQHRGVQEFINTLVSYRDAATRIIEAHEATQKDED